jgi:hypothetical protein
MVRADPTPGPTGLPTGFELDFIGFADFFEGSDAFESGVAG